MSPLELIRLALSRLRSARLRAALTMLGVIIGVASVVALVGVGQGTTSDITSRLAALGTNLLTVNPTGGPDGDSETLSLDDADAIAGLADVAGVAPEVSAQATVEAGDTTTDTTIIGTTAAYPTVRAFDVWQGSFLTDAAVESELRVAVLGASTAEDLGLGADDIGSEISIGGLPFRLVGILQPKGGAGFQDPDDMVLVPVTVVQKYFAGGDEVRTIGISVSTPDRMAAVSEAVSALLRERHDLGPDDEDDFTIFDQAQLLETASSISGTLTLLLAGIASISLLVGGIGIMNIMLVAVRERTREIGIRKAIGAKRRDILLQFLVEALTLSLLGGAVGVACGVLISALIGRLAGWGLIVDPATIAVALGFSLAVGVVFGVWPARQAARLDPVAALRYE
jgi:putative ABC transport system permease protein